MKKYLSWQVILGISLLILSIIFYLLHYMLFRDAHHIFIYLVGDVAFVFIEVFMVTFIIHRLLNEREKRARLEKLNMVIGAFFSEVGTELVNQLSDFDPELDAIRKNLIVNNDWSEIEFSRVNNHLRKYDYGIDIKKVNLDTLHNFLNGKRAFMLRLLENPNLLEHESFTGFLRAVFHLTEELAARDHFLKLPDTDYEHISVDIKRVYALLVHQWLDYMKHLKNHHPYLFSLAMRTNPFDRTASPVVK